MTDTSMITSIWSAYGHRFMSDGNGDDEYGYTTESCLTCGAMYQLSADEDDATRGTYTAIDGSEPHTCTGDTSMSHGYPGERDDSNGANVDHNCNCIRCNS